MRTLFSGLILASPFDDVVLGRYELSADKWRSFSHSLSVFRRFFSLVHFSPHFDTHITPACVCECREREKREERAIQNERVNCQWQSNQWKTSRLVEWANQRTQKCQRTEKLKRKIGEPTHEQPIHSLLSPPECTERGGGGGLQISMSKLAGRKNHRTYTLLITSDTNNFFITWPRAR